MKTVCLVFVVCDVFDRKMHSYSVGRLLSTHRCTSVLPSAVTGNHIRLNVCGLEGQADEDAQVDLPIPHRCPAAGRTDVDERKRGRYEVRDVSSSYCHEPYPALRGNC